MIKNFSSIYIHIPFCKQKCFFCSFVISVAKNHRVNQYLDSLNSEMKKHSKKKIKTIYIGGGTPSFLDERQIKKLFYMIKDNFVIDKKCEITFEINPDLIDLKKAKLLRSLGVNRVSLGAQSFSNKYLKFLGRTHCCSDIRKSFFILRKAGFSNINLDFMYGFPGQTTQELAIDLKKMVDLKSEHLSLYTLTIDPHSKFYRTKVILPTGDALARFYVFVVKFLEKKGFCQYEISNFASDKKQSLHNCIYWNGGNYVGFGVGAHSHLDGERYWNVSKLYDYIVLMQKKKSSVEGKEKLSVRLRMMESLLIGLRMNKGVKIGVLEKRFGQKISSEKKKKIECFISDGFFELKGGVLCCTMKGRLVLDEISARLI
ncbi:MAG: radical SAM family heme chaperone HemW [Candidatus Omnitrophica bacterium]|nr:radical SAM family heme chaperone HemW [Candidatus Omnitrophota bacterium]